MKRLMLAVLALIGALIIPYTANAQVVTETLDSQNGVDCYVRNGGDWPENGHFYYCGTNATSKSEMLTLVKNLRDTYANLETALPALGTTIVIVDNPLDYAKYIADHTLTTPELEAAYAEAYPGGPEYGRTLVPPTPITVIYENVASGTFPAMNPASLSEMRHTVVHEFGHQYDNAAIAGTGSPRSAKTTFQRAVRKDETQMELEAEGTNTAQTLRANYSYFLVPNPGRKELYAEEFAYFVISDHGAAWGISQFDVADDALTPYYKCSRLVAQKHLTNDRDPNTSELQIAGCDGTVLCYIHGSGSDYPANGINAYVCGPSTDSDDPTTLETNNMPSPSRSTELYETDLNTELAKGANSAVKTKLADNRVMYFFFRTRAEATQFFDKQRPVSNNSGYKPGTTSSERCGHTFYNSAGVIVAVAIFDQCALTPGDTTNPDLLRTSIHETGRAFGLAFQKAGGADPSAAAGFTLMHTTDRTNITPSNWSSYLSSDKDTFICGMFGTVGNSQLERDLGAPSAAPPNSTTHYGPVCTSGAVNAPWKNGSTYRTPSTIALNNDKIPNSIIDSERRTWAEEFTTLLLGNSSPADVMPITDTFLGYDTAPTVGGVTPKRSMNCTRFVVETYRSTGSKPTNSQLTGIGCPTHADYNP